MLNIRENIYDEISAERDYQDRQWGGPAHDDKHGSHDWVAYLNVYLGNAVKADKWAFDAKLYRKAMIKVAALAVAAVEWVDRNHSNV
jgi:hypothetical protein